MNINPDILAKLSGRVSVILVEPKYQGNVGAVARLLLNFGLNDLTIVNFEDFTDEAYARSMNGKEILLKSRRVSTFQEAVKGFDVVVGTSSTVTGNYRKFRRIPMLPGEFWDSMGETAGRIALVFGREDDGLRNEELELCNHFIHIPANPDYPVLNLSHAVSVVLYEMIRNADKLTSDLIKPAEGFEVEKLVERIRLVMDLTGYPDYKIENTTVMLRRIIARSHMTDSEFFKIMGIIRSILHGIDPDADID